MIPNTNGRSPSGQQRRRLPRMVVAVLAACATVAALAAAPGGSAAAQTNPAASPPAATTASPSQPPACTGGTTVETDNGPVCGATADGVTSYLGIPYAAPPVGKLRWEPPQPHRAWTQTLTATQPPEPPCAEPGTPGGVGVPSNNEDCLYLRVQVPDSARPGRGLPVMVHIHGGGFLIGSAGDGSHFVNAGHVVYVAINYRLGIFGNLALKALGPNSGDYGLQDQQAALRWVQRNIARFGGDPHNVTIFGTSAGGASVCDAVASPTAKGLFQHGISRSGFYNSGAGPNQVWEAADCKSQLPTEAQAQAAGAAFAADLGCGNAPDVAACMREVPAKTLLEKAGQVLAPNAGGTIAPIVNGTTLPMSPAEAFRTGHVNDVSLMAGVNRDEINGGVQVAGTTYPTTPSQYRELLRGKYGSDADKVSNLYPLTRFPTPSAFIAFRTAVADADSVCPALTAFQDLSKHIPVYAYENDNADAPIPGYLSKTGLPWGSSHGAGPTDPAEVSSPNQQALARQITAQWVGYARTGNPTVDGTPLWSQFQHGMLVMSQRPAGDSVLTPASTLAMQHHCGFWNRVERRPASAATVMAGFGVTTAQVGDQVTDTAVVTNTGAKTLGKVTVTFYPDVHLSGDHDKRVFQQIHDLAPGTSATVTATYTAGPPGTVSQKVRATAHGKVLADTHTAALTITAAPVASPSGVKVSSIGAGKARVTYFPQVYPYRHNTITATDLTHPSAPAITKTTESNGAWITGLTGGDVYQVTVTTTSTAGTSAPSNPVTFTARG